jgi:hypothetical protein
VALYGWEEGYWKKSMKNKTNWKVVILSIIALGFIALTFLVNWIFILGAVIIFFINQRELAKVSNK